MENEYRIKDHGTVTAFESGVKDGERHYWIRHNETGDVFSFPVVEVKRLVATNEWEPVE